MMSPYRHQPAPRRVKPVPAAYFLLYPVPVLYSILVLAWWTAIAVVVWAVPWETLPTTQAVIAWGLGGFYVTIISTLIIKVSRDALVEWWAETEDARLRGWE